MSDNSKVASFEEIKIYLEGEISKIIKALNVNSIEEALKKIEEIEKNKNISTR
jgi:hypothetical protein